MRVRAQGGGSVTNLFCLSENSATWLQVPTVACDVLVYPRVRGFGFFGGFQGSPAAKRATVLFCLPAFPVCRNGLFVVGPESCRAHPGPVCYKKGGHLAITDANLQLGRILPETFPKIFGPNEVGGGAVGHPWLRGGGGAAPAPCMSPPSTPSVLS